VRDDGRRARIVATVAERDTTAGVGELMRRLCQFAADEMSLSGCALVLMSGAEAATMVAGAGRHARTIAGLQMELGEGPCLQAYSSGIPVLLPDLAAEEANRWPTFAAAALAVGVQAEFSLPLSVGPSGIGTFDLCRDAPGMLSADFRAALLTLVRSGPGRSCGEPWMALSCAFTCFAAEWTGSSQVMYSCQMAA
jgi:hypothetical protein